MNIRFREASAADCAPARALVREAFRDNDPEGTAAFLDALRHDGCILGEWLAEDATGPLAHIVFSRVWVRALSPEGNPEFATVAGVLKALGLRLSVTQQEGTTRRRAPARSRGATKAKSRTAA